MAEKANYTWMRVTIDECVNTLTSFPSALRDEAPLVLAKDIKNVVSELNEVLYDLVRQARSDGRTWREVGDALSVTPQGAQQRFYGLPGQSSTIHSEVPFGMWR